MKRFICAALLGLGFCSVASAAPDQIYQNSGITTNTPQIDAIIFWNAGTFETFTDSNNLVDISSGFESTLSAIPYSTFDTLYYTNTASGTMLGIPGFEFDTVTSTTRHGSSLLHNDGIITAFDVEAEPILYSVVGSMAVVPIFGDSQPIASQIQVLCTNILNDGTISVGNYGVLKMIGSNVNLVNGALVAGAVDTGNVLPDAIDTTSGADLLGIEEGGLEGYYVNPAGVYDLYWGVTNGATLNLTGFAPPEVPAVPTTERTGVGRLPILGDLPLELQEIDPAQFAVYAELTQGASISNLEYNIVFVNTNFTDLNGQPNTNITVNVGFNSPIVTASNSDAYALMAMVQFAVAVPDVITGQMVTNAVYLLDSGAALGTIAEDDNASSANGYNRPSAFGVTTATPEAFWPGLPAESVYDPTLLYSPNTFVNTKVKYNAAEYGVQIGRNPAEVDGSFNFPLVLTENLLGSNVVIENYGSEGAIILPDPTDEPARVELTANQLNLSNARLRAEGMVTINASNIVGLTAGSDWGEINSQIGTTNGSLVISNFFLTNYQRLRGDIYAWSGTWQNIMTNGIFPGTNNINYHVLVVGQNLGANFQSAIRNLSLSGTNSIKVYDPLYVINQSYFNTSNLTFNANTTFTQNAGSLTTANNLPHLKNFLNNTNASLSVDNLLDMGFDPTQIPAPPAGRQYTLLSITNLGSMAATAPFFQSQIFENDGTIVADNNGSMIIEAASLGLGLALTNATNYLLADGGITLSAIAMGFSNSYIIAGDGTNSAGQGQLLLQTTSGGQITDFIPAVAGTNSYTTNMWQVTAGFALPVLPQGDPFGPGTTSDLFGTEITTIATGYTVALHTWAGADLGATSAGFVNNMVIGHLKLSRQSPNAELYFTGAGAKNGMYVDYLELDTNSLSASDYRHGLVIDPNLTIYFAACNVDPSKLTTVYTNRLVWVPSFAGPNSTVSVPYTNCAGVTNYCLMNASLAYSTDPALAFFPGILNADNQPFVLNDPSGNCANVYPCPGVNTMFKDFAVLTRASNDVNVEITTVGDGSISPNLKQSQIAIGNTYKLTATPSSGWVFAGWSGSGLPAGVDTTSPVFNFELESNLTLTANFTPKTFTLVKGTYYGLFLDSSNQPVPANSGWFTFTVGANGTFSGRLLMGSTNYTFSSTFSTAGSVQTAAKHGSQSVTVNLQLDMTGQTGQVTGYVTEPDEPAIQLLGYLAPVWTAKDSSPFAGKYTMILTNDGTNSAPGGDGYGSLTVSKLGVLSVAGRLADGNAFNQSVPISKDGLWPFYTYGASGGDYLLGWIAFQRDERNSYTMGKTNLFWGKSSYNESGTVLFQSK